MGCVFPMVVVSALSHAEFGPNDLRENAPHFIKIRLVLKWLLQTKAPSFGNLLERLCCQNCPLFYYIQYHMVQYDWSKDPSMESQSQEVWQQSRVNPYCDAFRWWLIHQKDTEYLFVIFSIWYQTKAEGDLEIFLVENQHFFDLFNKKSSVFWRSFWW